LTDDFLFNSLDKYRFEFYVLPNVANVAVVTAFVAEIALFPLNCRRQAGEKPLSGHFGSAGDPALATEMTQMQREVRSMPPPCKGTIAVQFVHKNSYKRQVSSYKHKAD
jgi:hypothetical protein